MDLSALKRVYAREGPFATVYLEGRSPGEDAEQQTRLRRRALRERLEAEHAPAAALDAAEEALSRPRPGEEQTSGRVLVTSADAGVVFDAAWDAALGRGDAAHWDPLPVLGPFVREAARAVRVLLVVADQESARLHRLVVAEEHEPTELSRERVEGSAVESPQHIREGALAHRRIQRRADEAVAQNAKEAAAAVGEALHRFAPDALVLAGEVQGRTALREQLPAETAGLLVETGRGGDEPGGSWETLCEEVLRIAGEHATRAAEDAAARLAEGLAHERGVSGHTGTLHAAEVGALETLLFEDGAAAKNEGELLRSAARTDASFALVPAGTGVGDGVAGILRFPPIPM
ncbi:hypothetical protein [Streptomyces sp. NPDC048172]|uniref:baeRF2 domain-containing protein n=1 Tax=Streptomyces sp. NPDC048172 TaxID=3365505 RepID=UPI0037224F85